MSGRSLFLSRLRRRARLEFSDSLRLRLALKTAVACLIALFAARRLGFSEEYWAVISAFLIVQLSIVDTLRRGMMRVAGTGAGCLFGLFLALLFPGKLYLSTALLFVWCLCLFYAAQKGRYSYAISLAAITPFLVVMADTTGLHHAVALAFDRFATITLGVLISGLVIAFLWPVREGRELTAVCGKMIKKSLSFCLTVLRDPSSEKLATEETELRGHVSRIEYLLAKTDFSRRSEFGPRQVRSLLTALRSLLSYALHLKKMLVAAGPEAAREKNLEESRFVKEVLLFREKVMKVPAPGVPAYLAAHRDKIERICASLEEERMSLFRPPGSSGKIEPGPVARLMFLFYLAETLTEIADISARPAEKEAGPAPAGEGTAGEAARGRGFDPVAGRGALKTSVAVIASTLAWAIPLKNIQSVISATLIAGQPHQTASYRRAFFRVLGTILGGAAGFALVLFFGRWEEAIALPATALILLFSYVGLGEEDWHYTGLTAGLCFILVMGGISPEHRLPPAALRRLAGVCLGGITAALAVKFIFPCNYRRRLREIENNLLSLYRRSLAALGKRIAGETGAESEIGALRWEMRAASIDYGNVCGAITWDRIRDFRRREDYSRRGRLSLDIYRNFFPLFSIGRCLSSEISPVPLRERIGGILSRLSEEVGDERSTPAPDWASGLEALESRVLGLRRDLDEIESASAGDFSTRKEEMFFFVRIFLHHLRILIENFRQLRSLR